jgi:hypothetical protein
MDNHDARNDGLEATRRFRDLLDDENVAYEDGPGSSC